MKNEKNSYKSPSAYKSKDRPDLFTESLKAVFLNKKIGMYTNGMHITGTCTDIHQGGTVFCLIDAKLTILSSISDILVDKEVSFIMVERQGKTLTLEGE